MSNQNEVEPVQSRFEFHLDSIVKSIEESRKVGGEIGKANESAIRDALTAAILLQNINTIESGTNPLEDPILNNEEIKKIRQEGVREALTRTMADAYIRAATSPSPALTRTTFENTFVSLIKDKDGINGVNFEHLKNKAEEKLNHQQQTTA